MGKMYTKADKPMQATVQAVMEKHHKSLAQNKVAVGTLFVESEVDEKTGVGPPALSDRGMPCLARIRLAPTRDRILHGFDAILEIDGLEFDGLSALQRAALIDHELTHLRFKTNGEGEYLRDGMGRPKLEVRPHDWEVSGFTSVVERHKANAVEAINFSRVGRNHRIGGQGVFEFMVHEIVGDARKKLLSPTGADKKAKGMDSVVALLPGHGKNDPVSAGREKTGRVVAKLNKNLKAAAAGSGASGVKGKSQKTAKRK